MAGFDEEETCLWVTEVDRFDRMLDGYGAALLRAAALSAGDRVLDVGCGAGATTRAAADAASPGGAATGIDCNGALVAVARRRSADRRDVDYVCADAAVRRFRDGAFDALISRFGMMLFDEPGAAFANLARTVVPGGTVTYTTWTRPEDNGWYALPFRALGMSTPAAAVGPFALADPERNRALLAEAGLRDIEVETVETQVWVARDVEDAAAFLRRSLVHRIPPQTDLDALLDRAEPLFAEHTTADGVLLPAVALVCSAVRAAAP